MQTFPDPAALVNANRSRAYPGEAPLPLGTGLPPGYALHPDMKATPEEFMALARRAVGRSMTDEEIIARAVKSGGVVRTAQPVPQVTSPALLPYPNLPSAQLPAPLPFYPGQTTTPITPITVSAPSIAPISTADATPVTPGVPAVTRFPDLERIRYPDFANIAAPSRLTQAPVSTPQGMEHVAGPRVPGYEAATSMPSVQQMVNNPWALREPPASFRDTPKTPATPYTALPPSDDSWNRAQDNRLQSVDNSLRAAYQQEKANAATNYSAYKEREAQKIADLNREAVMSQSPYYPGSEYKMPSIAFTNARQASDWQPGGGDGYDAAIAAQQAKLNYLTAGGGGWLGLFQSGGAQKQLNTLRQQQMDQQRVGIEAARAGTEQQRLQHDITKYWQGENPIAWAAQQLGMSRLELEKMMHYPDIQRANALNALFAAGRDGDYEALRRAVQAFSGKSGLIVMPGPFGTRIETESNALQNGGNYYPNLPQDPTKPAMTPGPIQPNRRASVTPSAPPVANPNWYMMPPYMVP